MSNILGNMPPVFGSGYRGVVPAPTAADVSAQNILRADGTWGAQATSGPLPSQTGNAGELLTTDGTNASWTPSLNDFSISNLTFGTSGPSAKSSIAARAARQGVGQDGTNGVSVSTPALGTTDFSISFLVRRDSSSIQQYLIGNDNPGCLYVGFRTSGALYSGKAGGSANADLNIGNVVGKWQHIVLVRSGGNITGYADGVSVGSVTDAGSNYTAGAYSLFQASAGVGALVGAALSPYFYNRALSAAEVVSLYESGVPSGSDYNSASNTSVVTAAWTDSGTYTTFSSASASTFTAVRASGTGYSGLGAALAAPIRVGQRFLVTGTLTLNNGKTVQPRVYLDNTASLQTVPVGAFSITLTATAANGGISFTSTGDADYTISGLSITRLGLLLAPDAAQAGGGLTWYDTSGNAANITLPASGVSWNVPSSLKTASGWTYGGNLTVSGTGTSSVAGSFQVGATSEPGKISLFQSGTKTYSTSTGIDSDYWGVRVNNTSAANQAVALQLAVSSDNGTTAARGAISAIQPTAGVNTGALAFQTNTGGTISETMRLVNGNLLVGTTTDSGGIIQAKGSAKLIGATTEDVSLDMGVGRSGNGNAFIDLVGDATYTDYGLRIIRGNTGANAGSAIKHRGTGVFDITCIEGAAIQLVPEPGVDNYIGYGPTRDTYLTAKATGTHNLRDATGANWWTFDRNKTFIVNTTSAPGSNPTGGGYLYVESGALKYRGSSGTVTTIANA